MAGARWAALAVASAIAVGIVGCGGGEDKPSGTNIAAVTPGARDEADWSRQTTDAVEAAAKKLHVRAKVVEGSSEAPVKPILRGLARNAQLLVALHYEDREAAVQVATATKVPTLVWNDPGAARPGLVGNVEADLAPAAYQAGALAIRAARESSVAIVLCDDGSSGWDMLERFRIAAAYVSGAKAANPKAKAAFVIAGSDAGGAKTATVDLGKRKFQMIMAICGPSVSGVFDGIEELVKDPVTGEDQIVGLIGDKGTLNRENLVVTSILVNPGVAIEQAVRDIRADKFGKRPYELTLENRGITLLRTGRTPGDAYEEAVKFEVPAEIPTARDEVTLEALIAE